MSAAVRLIIDKLREHGSVVKNSGSDEWRAQCPAHDDSNPSLSIGKMRDGRGAVVRCHRGCTHLAIVAALNLTERDLYDDEGIRDALNPVRAYQYATRTKHRKLKPGGGKTFYWTGTGTDKSLYGVNTIGDASVVYLCEGEKAVDVLRQLGHVAVATGGAERTDVDFTPLMGGTSG